MADQLGIAGFNSNIALMTPYVITIVALVIAGVQFHRIRTARAAVTPTPQTA